MGPLGFTTGLREQTTGMMPTAGSPAFSRSSYSVNGTSYYRTGSLAFQTGTRSKPNSHLRQTEVQMSFAKLLDVCAKYTFCEMGSTVFTRASVTGQGFCPGRISWPSLRASPGGPAQGLGKPVAGEGPATLGGRGRLGTGLPELLTMEGVIMGNIHLPPTPAFLSSFFLPNLLQENVLQAFLWVFSIPEKIVF